MLSIITPIDNYNCDYKLGSKILYKGTDYIINVNWANELKLNPTQIALPNYKLSIDLTDKKLLIIRAMGAGDMLFLSPAIALIKEKYPTCQIGLACIKEQHGIVELISGIDEILDYPIERESFDTYDHYFQVADIVEGNSSNKDANIYQAYISALTEDDVDVQLRPKIKDEYLYASEIDQKLIAIHPFANDPIRSLNLNIIAGLAAGLTHRGYTVIIIGTETEYKIAPHLHQYEWSKDRYPTFSDVCGLLRKSRFAICSDSLIVHLAQAVGTETICFYGPFPSKSRVSGYKNIHIFDSNPECRCHMHQLGRCKRGLPEPVCLRFDIGSIINIVEDNPTILDELPLISAPEIEHYGVRDE